MRTHNTAGIDAEILEILGSKFWGQVHNQELFLSAQGAVT